MDVALLSSSRRMFHFLGMPGALTSAPA